MASAPFHFAVGAVAGMAVLAPRLAKAWESRSGLAPTTRFWLLASWSCGVASALPSLLRYAGVPESVTTGPWMNVFFLHPWINQWLPRTELLGGAAMGACIACQYAWILLAIRRAGDVRRR